MEEEEEGEEEESRRGKVGGRKKRECAGKMGRWGRREKYETNVEGMERDKKWGREIG